MVMHWEVVFDTNSGFEAREDPNEADSGDGKVSVDFKPEPGHNLVPDGPTRVVFYGKLKIKAIPGSDSGSYEIPPPPPPT